MPAVMNRQRLQALAAEHLARRAEPATERVTRQTRTAALLDEQADEALIGRGAMAKPFRLPAFQIRQRPGIPPQRDHAGPAAFRSAAANPQMGPRRIKTDVRQTQPGDLGDTKPTTARQADQDQVEPGVARSWRLPRQVGQYGGQFAAGQDLRGVDADLGAEVHVVLLEKDRVTGMGQLPRIGGGREAMRTRCVGRVSGFEAVVDAT
jgi:hypothetical protein